MKNKKIPLKDIIKSEDIVIHTPKEEQAIYLCKKLFELGRKWRGGGSYLKDTHWNFYKTSSCYYPYCNQSCARKFYEEKQYTIIDFGEVDFEIEEPKISIKYKNKKIKRYY